VKRCTWLICFVLRLAAAADDVQAGCATRRPQRLSQCRRAPGHRATDESHVTVESSGRPRQRCVTLCGSWPGRPLRRVARHVYVTASGKIKDFRAWMLAAGREIRYGKDRILDVQWSTTISTTRCAPARSPPGRRAGRQRLATKWSKRSARYSRNSSGGFNPPACGDLPLHPHAAAGWTARGITITMQRGAAVSGHLPWELKNLPYLQSELYSPKSDAIVRASP